MSDQADDLIKRREIGFSTLHPDAQPAHSAAAALARIDGIIRVVALDGATLKVEYHLSHICLHDIEGLLESQGYHLDNRLMFKVKRALYRYTEETQRANLGCVKSGESISTQKAFATSYCRRDHGCRDDRPTHWRRYL